MKRFPTFGLMLAATALLASCNTDPLPTYDLTVKLTGVTSAPVKITNTTTGAVIFNDTLNTSKTFSGLTSGSIVTVTGQPVSGYETPAAQSVTLDSSKTLTVTYKAIPVTRTLTVNLSGVSSAPLKITNTTTGTVIVDSTVTSGQQFTGIPDGSVLKVEARAVAGFTTPAAQTVTLKANSSIAVTYTPPAVVTRTLTVNLSGVSSAPLKITNTTTGSVIFNGSVTSGQKFSGIKDGSVIRLEPQAVNGMTTPAPQDITLNADKAATVTYAVSPVVTHTLTVSFTGVSSAPVMIVNDTAGAVIYDGTVSNGQQFTGIPDGSVITLTPAAISGYTTPAPQTLKLNGDMSVHLNYAPLSATSNLNPTRISGVISGNTLKLDKVYLPTPFDYKLMSSAVDETNLTSSSFQKGCPARLLTSN